jgi:hypothetical protein
MKFIPDSKLAGKAMPRLLADFRQRVVGKSISQAGYVEIDGNPYPALLLSNGLMLAGMGDDEGNGPGSLQCVSHETPDGNPIALPETSIT